MWSLRVQNRALRDLPSLPCWSLPVLWLQISSAQCSLMLTSPVWTSFPSPKFQPSPTPHVPSHLTSPEQSSSLPPAKPLLHSIPWDQHMEILSSRFSSCKYWSQLWPLSFSHIPDLMHQKILSVLYSTCIRNLASFCLLHFFLFSLSHRNPLPGDCNVCVPGHPVSTRAPCQFIFSRVPKGSWSFVVWSVSCFFSFFVFSFLYWSRFDLQCCVSFRCTIKWFNYTYTYISSFSDFSHLGYYRVLSRVPWAIQ